MPPFFDRSQLNHAINARALPALEMLADHPNHLERARDNRFERDDPPPYESSNESEEEAELLNHPVLARTQQGFLDEFGDRIREPLSDKETQNLVTQMNHLGLYRPGTRFLDEARREHRLLDTFYFSRRAKPLIREFMKGHTGHLRREVIVRRNIRKRWQRLGVWNPEWGIPKRCNKQPNDNVATWKWKWESDQDPPPSHPRHPISRAVQLRSGLGSGQHITPPPRSKLQDEAPASEAESFVISRPWFVFSLESQEDLQRNLRVPMNKWPRRKDEEDHPITKRWKECGDWKEGWLLNNDPAKPIPGWKWRHESPSPEPEDLTPLNTEDMDFTPSEFDALEAVPSRSPTPEPLWPTARPLMGHPQPYAWYNDPGDKLFRSADPPEPEPELDGVPEDIPLAEDPEPAAQPTQEEEQGSPQPRPRRRGRPRSQPQPADAASPPAPVRRSARIAAKNAQLPAATPAPATRAGRARAPRPPAAAPPPPASRSTAEAPKRRGRPRKTQSGGITKTTAPPSGKRRGRPSGRAVAVVAAAVATQGRDVEEQAPAGGSRRRGRPRRS